MTDATKNVWPLKLRIRDTQLHDDLGGAGMRIYTTAGQGYEKREYVRADEIERLEDALQIAVDDARLHKIEIERLEGEHGDMNLQNVKYEKRIEQLEGVYTILQDMRHDHVKYPQLRLPDMQHERLKRALDSKEHEYKPV